MSLALLTLGLLCARPAQAQTPGHWEFDHLECQGDDTGSGGRDMGPSWEFPWVSNVPTNPYCSAPGNTTPIFDSYGDVDSSSINVTITPFFQWVPGSDPSAPPTILHAKIKSEAYAGDENGDPVSADNGFEDVSSQLPRGYVFYDDSDKASAGTHLEQKDPRGQTLVSLPPQTLSASGGKANDFQSISSEVDYQADTDDRAVTITSSLGQTNHKGSAITDNGSPQQMPDVPDADGTVHANTLKPTSQSTFDGSPTSIDYYAHPAGSWAANSSYHWNIVEGDGGTNPSDGTFTMPDDPPYSNGAGYYRGSTSGGPEHVYIHLTDAADGANATANYYVQWHDPVENWATNGSSIPMPPTPYGDTKASQPAGGQATVEIDVPPGKVSAAAGDRTLGGVITTAASVVAVAAPETDPVIIGLMTAAGYTLSVEPDPADQSYKIPGPESQFKADVATQVAINNGNTSGVFRPDLPRMDSGLANAISQSGDYDGYFSGKYGTISFGVQIFQLQWSQNYLGDGYDIHGYTGDATGTVSWPGAIPTADYVFNWTKVTPPSP